MADKELTFWEHLDELRGVIMRVFIGITVGFIIAFVCKEAVFDILLAPNKNTFLTYSLCNSLAAKFGLDPVFGGDMSIELISTELMSQFMIHMKMAFYIGILFASPYIIYQLFGYVAPALYENERRYSSRVIFFSFFLFIIGVLVAYYVVFPFSFQFLAGYQVTADVKNTITLQSYTDTFIILSLMMGIMFEIPIVAWLLGKLGVLTADILRRFRKHSLIVILIIAAVITPTSDIFTLLLVSIPIYLLYEASILIVRNTKK